MATERKKHASGGATFFRDDGTPKPKRPRKSRQRSKPATPVAATTPLKTLPPEQVDAAYSKLIAKLDANSLHRLDLRHRGLSDDEIARRQYRSMPGPGSRATVAAELAEELGELFRLIPGFGFNKDGKPTVFGASVSRSQFDALAAASLR